MKTAFAVVCWIVAIYFATILHIVAGFPPRQILNDGNFIYILLFMIFLLLPFTKTLEIGSVFKYSAKIEEIKSEVKDFKEEIRGAVSLQSSLINNVSQTVSHRVNITLPTWTEARAAEEKLSQAEHSVGSSGPQSRSFQESAVAEYVQNAEGDTDSALMRLRRDLERELRRVLEKQIPYRPGNLGSDRPRHPTLRSLWNMFVERYPDQKNSEQAFFYVVDVCNAAAHGQVIPPEIAEEALSMGIRVLEIMRMR